MNTFLISDTHFGHKGVTEFLNYDGTKLRPWDNVEKMDEALVKKWNDVVRPKDKVYHLGDVVINRKALKILERLNGEKVLVKGNHDIFKPEDYSPYFKDIRAYHKLDGFLLAHIPIHPESMGRYEGQFHGHLHSNFVMLNNELDTRYFNVSVERIGYTPIAFEEAKRLFLKRKQHEYFV